MPLTCRNTYPDATRRFLLFPDVVRDRCGTVGDECQTRRPCHVTTSFAVLRRSARELARLCRDGAALVAEARAHHADAAVMAAARKMASDLQRTEACPGGRTRGLRARLLEMRTPGSLGPG